MFPKKIFPFDSWEYILKIHHSKQDLDYMIPKGICQISLPNPNYMYFGKGNDKFN